MIDLEAIDKLSEIVKNIDYEIYLKLKKVDNEISISSLLKIFNLDKLPEIVPYTNNKSITVELKDEEFRLFLKGDRWMSFHPGNLSQMFEVFSHYSLAEGHCICTGLGFALRENWLLSNQKVSKITVLEKNKEIIEYHEKINPFIMDKIEVINCDASEFKGECDTLLLDHYEYEFHSKEVYFENITICTKNINHSKLWFWPLEEILMTSDLFKNEYSTYQYLKKRFPTLPNVSKSQLISYCKIFNFFANY